MENRRIHDILESLRFPLDHFVSIVTTAATSFKSVCRALKSLAG